MMVWGAFLGVTLASTAKPMANKNRIQDWRNGPVIYQVFVDRFSASTSVSGQANIIASPRKLKNWSDLPSSGKFLPENGLWSHELEFWGGDIPGIQSKLDYVNKLGADVLYLTPIHSAFSNHKYDAHDYLQVAPEFGTQKDLENLIAKVHLKNMKIILDGVFNHVGRSSALFQQAHGNSKSARRNWFYFDKRYQAGYRAWAGVGNLPALNLENRAVQNYLWRSPDSVVRHYLKLGVDGWRLDVAFELGDDALLGITKAAHESKPGSLVVGEINGYPADWFHCVDGVFNFYTMNLAIRMAKGELSSNQFGRMLVDLVQDAGLESLLKSWLVADNHDTDRLASQVKDTKQRRIVQALQFTLPGSPVIYYGSELGMEGIGDPANRAPMRWDMTTGSNADRSWIEKLIRIRKRHLALRYGDIRVLATDRIFGFARITDKVAESALVLVNPTDQEQTETTSVRMGKIMSWGELKDEVSGTRMRCVNGIIDVKLAPKSVMILTPVVDRATGYSPYDRIK